MTEDEQAGIQWWNGLNEADRTYWCMAANTAIPAMAWKFFKQQQEAVYDPKSTR